MHLPERVIVTAANIVPVIKCPRLLNNIAIMLRRGVSTSVHLKQTPGIPVPYDGFASDFGDLPVANLYNLQFLFLISESRCLTTYRAISFISLSLL